jgi:hypothetical protein
VVLPAALSIVLNMFTEGAERNKALGLWGAITVTGALVVMVYAISRAPATGWTAIRTLALLAVSAALLAGFLVIEARAEAPLLPLRLFRLKTLAGSNAVGFLLGASFYGYIFTLYMQQVLGYSAMKTGLAWLAVGLTGVVLAGPAQMLVTRARQPSW